jgi:hypothetical protein
VRPAALRRGALAGPAVALALALTACAGTAPSSAATGSSPASSGAVHQIHIHYAHGKVTGDTGRVQVRSGEEVRLTVDSDVADEVHVHGYNLMGDVAPGKPATVSFRADTPGVFEVELEHLGKQLFTFQVS